MDEKKKNASVEESEAEVTEKESAFIAENESLIKEIRHRLRQAGAVCRR